jgi:hypothetical protein
MKRTSEGVPAFEITDIGEIEDGWWFECAMVSTCAPLFDGCDSNYEVEQELKTAGVIEEGDQTDSESCALVVNFDEFHKAENFLGRLNQYLEQKAA